MEEPLWSPVRERRSRTITLTSVPIALAGVMPAGTVAERRVQLAADVPGPSARCSSVSVEYRLRVDVGLAGGDRVSACTQVSVVAGRAVTDRLAGGVRTRAAGACDLEFEVDGQFVVRLGDALRGTLIVRPKQAFAARRVIVYPRRVEVGVATSEYTVYRCTEPVRSRRRRRDSITLATSVDLRGPRSFPFAVRLPADACPTLVTPDCSVRWFLRAEVQHGQPESDVLERQVNVYNGQ